MANTCNIFATFAFLTFLSLSSAFVNQDFGISKDFQKNLDLELQPLLREKREEDAYLVSKLPLELEELSESQTIHDRRATEEETKKLNYKEKDFGRKDEEPNNDTEEDVKDDVFSYRSMYDLIQAFILADEQDIAMRLEQLREIENATEKFSNLTKRQISASASAAAAAAATGGLLGSNLWDAVPLTELDTYSCEDEAVKFGHVHVSGLVVHRFLCELRRIWHYFLIIVRNLREGLTLGPLIAEKIIAGGEGILSILFRPLSLLFHIFREPHHLLILPDIIRDAVPFRSIGGALLDLVHAAFNVIRFIHELWRHIRHIFGHFFLGHLHHHLQLGVNLWERILEHRLARLHHFHGLGSIVPLGEEIVGESGVPIIGDGDAIAAPDYHTSLAELLSSLRGAYDGYYASGIPHFIRSGVRSISTSTVYSKVISHLTNIPSYLTNIRSHLSSIPFFNGYTPLEQGTAQDAVIATSTSSASSSISTPVSSIVSPVVSPIVRPVEQIINPTIGSVAPIAPVETVSSSASASTTVVETPVVSPLISQQPDIVSSMPFVPSSDATSATATATSAAALAAAAASAAAASPIVSSYRTAPRIYAPIGNNVVEESIVPCAPSIEPVPTVPSEVISETVENTVSASSSSSVAVASPGLSEESAAAAASASGSSFSDVGPAISTNSVPFSLPYSLTGYRSRPIFSGIRPATALISSGDNLIESDQYRGLDLNLGGRIPLSRSHIFPASFPSVAPASSAAAAAASAAPGSAAAASSASTGSSGGLHFVLPREHIINALGHDHLTPGDIISLNLRNKAILVGRVLDAVSPISFNFLRPRLRNSLLHHGGRVWNLSPWDFKDPECIRRLNSPLLLRHAF